MAEACNRDERGRCCGFELNYGGMILTSGDTWMAGSWARRRKEWKERKPSLKRI